MVSRNDPCTCGSGKKYKKCCGKTNVVDMNVMIDEELDLIIEGFAEEGLGPREYGAIDSRLHKWTSALRNLFEPELIEALAMDTYIYFEEGTLWTNYIKKQIKKQKRSKIIEVLTEWQHPFLLLGKIVTQTGHSVTLRDEITGETHTINGDQVEEESHIGKWLFGIVMPDSRRGPTGLIGTDGLIFIPEYDSGLVDQLIQKLKESEHDYLSMYQLFAKKINHFDFKPIQQEVLDLTQQFLMKYQYDPQLMMSLLTGFLLNNELKAKKSSAVVAGAIQVGYDLDILSPPIMTMKELANYFDVSSTTLAKYRNQITEFLMEEIAKEKAEERATFKSPSILVDIGTDPRGTEQFMWEMLMRSKQQDFDAVEELNAYMIEKMKEEYKPINNHERAQLLCYQAYAADSVQERVQLTKKAEKFDSKLADVHLLLAEQSDHVVVQENHYLKALQSSSKHYDDSYDDAGKYVLNRPYLRALFAYSTWLMTQNQEKEALDYLYRILEINPSDQQGVRYIMVRAYAKLGLFEKAYDLLDEIKPHDDDAITHYLEMAIEKMETKEKTSKVALVHGEKLNPHVQKMLKGGMKPGVFPQSLIIQPGNQDEAKLIYWLVYGIL